VWASFGGGGEGMCKRPFVKGLLVVPQQARSSGTLWSLWDPDVWQLVARLN
jgi:hypothetical protein